MILIYGKYGNEPHISHYNTRTGNELRLPIPKTTLTKNSLIYESIKIYNHLPRDFKNIKGKKQFARSVQRFLQEKAYYSLEEYYSEEFV